MSNQATGEANPNQDFPPTTDILDLKRRKRAPPLEETTPRRRKWHMRRLTNVFLLATLTSSLTVAFAGSAQAAPGCIERSGDTSWGAGQISVCASDGQGHYTGYTTDKDADGQCVRWRIDWDNKPDSYTPWACPKGTSTSFNNPAPAGVSGVVNAYLERVRV